MYTLLPRTRRAAADAKYDRKGDGTVRVCWMYHDIMDLYGDKGNMLVLSKRCKDRGIPFELDTCGIGEEKDLSSYDLLFWRRGR